MMMNGCVQGNPVYEKIAPRVLKWCVSHYERIIQHHDSSSVYMIEHFILFLAVNPVYI